VQAAAKEQKAEDRQLKKAVVRSTWRRQRRSDEAEEVELQEARAAMLKDARVRRAGASVSGVHPRRGHTLEATQRRLVADREATGKGGGAPVGSGGESQRKKFLQSAAEVLARKKRRRKLAEWNAAAYGQGCWKDKE
jgi:hypothetical protein